jgi:hypothetical protein
MGLILGQFRWFAGVAMTAGLFVLLRDASTFGPFSDPWAPGNLIGPELDIPPGFLNGHARALP